ncbi:MAG: serine hydrolase domain-containing protein [Candidatus Heimdallarchaeota archaeon]
MKKESTIKNKEIIEALLEKIPKLMVEKEVTGLSLVLIEDGQIVWEKGFGLRDKKQNLPVLNNTLFEAASLTKTLVAFATLKLQEEGLIDLDKSLEDYLSQPYLPEEPLLKDITARIILKHTTGFPNWGKEKLKPKIFFPPDQRFSYSGEGYMYLQHVLEQITGKTLEEIIKEKILQPLKLTTASLEWDNIDENLAATGYLRDGKEKMFRPEKATAAGSLFISTVDFAKFVVHLMEIQNKSDSDLLSFKSLKEIVTPAVPVSDAGLSNKHEIPFEEIIESKDVFWGLGWGIEKVDHKQNIWHWGNNSSFQNLVFANLESRNGFVLMSNCEKSPLIWAEIVNIAMNGKHPGFDWLMSFYW